MGEEGTDVRIYRAAKASTADNANATETARATSTAYKARTTTEAKQTTNPSLREDHRGRSTVPALKTYDVFISHAWTYSDDYYRLVNLLNEANNFKWRNYSVPKHDPKDGSLEEALRKQIRPVNIVIILAGMYVNHSKWIEFEMDFADEKDKPMIGVRPRGAQRTPKQVQDRVKEMVGWTTSSIVDAIRKYAI